MKNNKNAREGLKNNASIGVFKKESEYKISYLIKFVWMKA